MTDQLSVSDRIMAVTVLNGVVEVGDRVAVAVLCYKSARLRHGTVLEIVGTADHPRLKVQVENCLRYNSKTRKYEKKPYIKTYDFMRNVVKL
jgi:hypothetical protein